MFNQDTLLPKGPIQKEQVQWDLNLNRVRTFMMEMIYH